MLLLPSYRYQSWKYHKKNMEITTHQKMKKRKKRKTLSKTKSRFIQHFSQNEHRSKHKKSIIEFMNERKKQCVMKLSNDMQHANSYHAIEKWNRINMRIMTTFAEHNMTIQLNFPEISPLKWRNHYEKWNTTQKSKASQTGQQIDFRIHHHENDEICKEIAAKYDVKKN